jgi:hypothetical protein
MSMLENLASSLECPVCLEVPQTGPISQCDNGHLLCNPCRMKLKDCPVCKKRLRINRNLTAEKILEHLPIKCQFSIHGCTKNVRNEDRSEHEKECQFRQVFCPKNLCKQKISISKLMDHVVEHQLRSGNPPSSFRIALNVSEESLQIVNRSVAYWETSYLQFHGKHFFGIYKLNAKDKELNFWVYQLGTPEETKNYNATITIENDDEEKLSFKSQVSSIDIPETEVYESGAVFICPLITIKRLMKQNSIEVNIEIDYVWYSYGKTEDIPPTVNIRCKFSKHGCNIEDADESIKSHETECVYREIQCVNMFCKEKVTVFRLLEHLDEKHGPLGEATLKGLRLINYMVTENYFHKSRAWKMGKVKYQGKDFLTVFLRNHGVGLWYTWMYMIGTEKEAAQYKFTITLPSQEKPELVFSSTVSSVDLSSNDVIKRGSVGCFTDFVARSVWNEKTRRMSFKFQITSAKTQADRLTTTRNGKRGKQKKPSPHVPEKQLKINNENRT